MNSHTLAKLLLEHPPVELLIQKDAEGNGYRRLTSADFDIAVKETDYGFDVYSLKWTADDCCMCEEDWEDLKNKAEKFAVIW